MQAVYFISLAITHCCFSEVLLFAIGSSYVVSLAQISMIGVIVFFQGFATVHYSFKEYLMMLHPMILMIASLNTLGLAFSVAAMSDTNVTRMAVIEMLEPVYVIALESIFKKTLSMLRFIGTLSMLFGVVFLLPVENVSQLSMQVFYCNVANFMFAARNILFKHISTKTFPGKPSIIYNVMSQVSAVQYTLYHIVVTMVFGIGYDSFSRGIVHISLREFVLIILSSFSIFISGLNEARMIHQYTTHFVGILRFVQRLILVCIGSYISGAELNTHRTYGLFLIILGSVLNVIAPGGHA